MTMNPQQQIDAMEAMLAKHAPEEYYSYGGVDMVRCACKVSMVKAVHPHHQATMINDYVLAEQRMRYFAAA